MKYSNKRMGLSVFWLVLGVCLIVLSVMDVIDGYWIGMGGGFLGVGIAQLIRLMRYRKDPEYREKVDVKYSDERNKFLASKAWIAAVTMYILLNGAAVIVLRILGYEQYSLWAAWNVCALLVLYWLSYLWASKKY